MNLYCELDGTEVRGTARSDVDDLIGPSPAADGGEAPSRPAVRVGLAAAAGGHLTELLSLRPAYEEFSHFYVLNRHPARAPDQLGRVYWVPDYGRGDAARRALSMVGLGLCSLYPFALAPPGVTSA